MNQPTKKKTKKGMIAASLFLTASIALSGCGGNSGANNGNAGNAGNSPEPGKAGTGKPVELVFTFWGSNYEKQAVEKMVDSFNSSHPDIHVTPQHIPGDYETKMNTLMATNELPDVAYLDTPLALKWGKDGKLLNFTPYLDQFPEFNDRLPQSKLYPEPGNFIGTTIAGDNYNLFYNKDLFAEEGVDLPPVTAEDAWTWDEFLKVAMQLTKDKNGKHPDEAGFDEKNIVQYGVDFPGDFHGWFPYLRSNGTDIASEDGKTYTMNSPEAVEVFQSLQDLIYKYHVAPTPTQKKNLPGISVQLQTKKIAMIHAGAWSLLDLAETKLNFGVGVLPKFKEPKTGFFGAGAVIFKTTKHPEAALEFYKFYNDPSQVNLYADGLWMPIEDKYYTDEEAVESWTNNPAHPPEFKTAALDYMLKYGEPTPNLTLINYLELQSQINPALDQIWTNKKPAKDVLDELKNKVQPLLQGRYSQTQTK
ncbi:ABC transporter substrate-binding protein [Paenibacillus nasutitermitis]|uniref:Sugar ABC transporter substrate-binding protein n=1 Tax=Paenibacillus nasutitermitis TaxID=1652958 RepID=A0A917E2V4_9BACL|nr:sugar ABC transporter substrate-binding protein [Paenibacillus nasutitermitis]GGD96006.1 sugar ABC transporter substrate-binding protein [Paenibacillus nasutitermitis]